MFTEHAFAEVAGEVRDDHGDIVVALHTIPENNHTDDAEQSNAAGSDESDDDGNEKHWGEAMAACCVVWICTLVGLLLCATPTSILTISLAVFQLVATPHISRGGCVLYLVPLLVEC